MDGGVQCWGDNSFGQLGDGTSTARSAPVPVAGLARGVAAIAAGSYHACALLSVGGVRCWGYNAIGQLGDGTTTDRKTPMPVVGLASGVAALTAGDAHTCALTTAGAVTVLGDELLWPTRGRHHDLLFDPGARHGAGGATSRQSRLAL